MLGSAIAAGRRLPVADKQVRQVRNEAYHQTKEYVGQAAAMQMAIAVAKDAAKEQSK